MSRLSSGPNQLAGLDAVHLHHETARQLQAALKRGRMDDILDENLRFQLLCSLEERERVNSLCTHCGVNEWHQRWVDDVWTEQLRFCGDCWGLVERWGDRHHARRLAEQSAERARELEASSVVYFLQRSDGLIKIGFSARFRTRLSTLSKEHGDLEVLTTEPGGRGRESELHARFHQARVVGEWFRPTRSLRSYIASLKATAEAA